MLDAFEKRRQHAFNKIEWHVPKEKRGGCLLDIGCGIGNGVVAALQQGFQTAVGIDINLQEFGWYNPKHFPDICRKYEIDPARALLIEADIFKTDFVPASFDCVLMLDSIEHVPNPDAFVSYAAKYLKPGGIMVLDTCPLYYSRAGHHLFDYFPPDDFPWVHLRLDFQQLLESRNVTKWSTERFAELNKATHDQIRASFTDAGFDVIQEVRGSTDDQEIATLLKRHRHLLNLNGIEEKWLFENWIMLAGIKR